MGPDQRFVDHQGSEASPAPPWLLAVFLLSGACGLTYQLLWIRQLTLVFGATSYAMALVVAVFMGGLALGSELAGRRADHIRSPLTVYGILEIAIGVAALLMGPAFRLAEALHWNLVPGDAPLAWSLGVQVVFTAVLLAVPTTAMGATLPILSRHVVRRQGDRGRQIGTLYSLNTLGAFLGTAFCGFVAIEWLGVSATTSLTAALNLTIGVAMLAVGRKAISGRTPAEPPGQSAPDPASARLGKRTILALGAISGFTALGYEVAWTRLLGMILLTTTYTYTTILVTVIGGLGVGGLVGAAIADRLRSPERAFARLQLGIAIGALAVFPVLTALAGREGYLVLLPGLDFTTGQLHSALICAAVVAPPALLMGVAFPLLCRAVTRDHGSVGRSVGQFYAVNTLAGVLGSLSVGFLLLPAVGTLPTIVGFAVINLIAGVVVAWPRRGESRASVALTGSLALVALGLGLSSPLHSNLRDLYEVRLPPGSQILHLAESRTSTVMVADYSTPPVRRIWIQSCWVAGTGGSQKMLGHLSMLHADPRPEIVGIAFGTGQSFGSASLYDPPRLTCVDLDRGVVEAGGDFFADYNHGLLQQQRVEVVIQDGRRYLGSLEEPVGAVMLEPLQPWSAGAVNLYTQEFYDLARAALGERGVVTQWLPLDDVPAELSRSVVATFAQAFDDTYLYLDNYDLWILGTVGLERPRMTDWQDRMTDGPILDELRSVYYGDPQSILSTLIVGPDRVGAYCGDAPLLTDDRPFMEFWSPRTLHDPLYAENVDALVAASERPLRGLDLGSLATTPGLVRGETARELALGLKARSQNDSGAAHHHFAAAYKSAPQVSRTTWFYRSASQVLASELVAQGEVESATAIYTRHLQDDGDFGGGWLNLGLLQAEYGDPDAAILSLERAALDEELASRAQAALGLLVGDQRGPSTPRTPSAPH